jgi:hypothetical protein
MLCPALVEAGEPGRLCPRCINVDRLAEVLDDVDLSPWPDASAFVSWVVRSAPEAQFEGLVDLLRLLRGGPRV